MAFTDQIVQVLLDNKEVIRKKAFELIKAQVEDRVPLVQELGTAVLTGNLPPERITQIQAEVGDRLPELCPSPSQLQALLNLKRNLEEKVVGLSKQTIPVENTANTVEGIISAVLITINVLKAIPIPNQFTTAGLVVTLGDLLDDIKEVVKESQAQIRSLTYVVGSVNQTITSVASQLSIIDSVLQICAQNQIDNPELYSQESQSEFQLLVDNLNASAYSQPLSQSYRGYNIEIQNDPTSPPIAPRRFAIVYNPGGGVLYRGPASFSSSTQVLIDEAKFYIDQLIG